MKSFVLLFLIFIGSDLLAAENCKKSAIGLENSEDMAEIYFFIGTCHYRNEDYKKAVDSWQKLIKLEHISEEFESLTIDVLNNLGFMMFFGLGIEKDQQQAIDYWKQAILEGHDEAEYHLCHAYADNQQSTYNPPKAKKHCRKALLIYQSMEPQDTEILNDIRNYLSRLN